MHDIKFISYDGNYPNLCSGTLVVSIDNNIISGEYVLNSGGSCYFTNNYSDAHVEKGWWTMETDWLPEEYRTEDVINRIIELVNENVPQGCCGGCL